MYCNFLYFSKNLILERLADSGDELYIILPAMMCISKHMWLMFCEAFKVFFYCVRLLRQMVDYRQWYAYYGLKNHAPVGAQ